MKKKDNICAKKQKCVICGGFFKMSRGCNLEKRCPSCKFLNLRLLDTSQNGMKLNDENKILDSLRETIEDVFFDTLNVSMEDKIESEEIQDIILKELDKILTTKELLIIKLYFGFIDGFSYNINEIAEILNIPIELIKKLIHSAVKKIILGRRKLKIYKLYIDRL